MCNQTEEDLTLLSNCNHEEADSRIFVHAEEVSQKGHRKITIHTADTDVIVLTVSFNSTSTRVDVDSVWGGEENTIYSNP